MTVKECYSQMNGDYNNVLSRFYDEAMIKRLLGRFIDDTSFRALEQAMAEGDVQAAFNAAHTLPGFLYIIAVCVFNAQATSANCISQRCRFDRNYF